MKAFNLNHVKDFNLYSLVCYFLLYLCLSIPLVNAKALKSAVSPENLTGFHVKILNFISEEMKTKIEILPVPFARRIEMLKSNQIDILVGLRKTPERQKYFIFIEPSYTRGKSVSGLFVNKKTKHFEYSNTPNPKKLIAVITGSAYIKDYTLPFPYETIEVISLDQIINMLDKGRIDAFIHGIKSTRIELNKKSFNNIKLSSKYMPNQHKKVPSYIAISKSSILVKKIKNLSIISQSLLTGKYKELHDSYYK